MSRTLRLRPAVDANGARDLRQQVQDAMVQVLEETPSIRSHEEFDAHHRQWCLRLMDFYTHHGVALTHGQAQKWINMTAKYLLVLNDARVGDLVRFLHVPIDNVIAKQAEAELQVERPKSRWSKLDTDGYEYYQRDFERHCRCKTLRSVLSNGRSRHGLTGCQPVLECLDLMRMSNRRNVCDAPCRRAKPRAGTAGEITGSPKLNSSSVTQC